MLESFKSIIGVVGPVVGIVAGLLGIALIIRKRQFSKPSLRLNVGLSSSPPEDVPRKYRKQLPSLLVFVPEKPTTHPLIVFLFLRLRNQGREALKNVRVVVEYDRGHLVDNELLKAVSKFEPTVVESRFEPDKVILLQSKFDDEEMRKALDRREASAFGDCAQISCEVPIIRPGETVIFYDLLLLPGRGPDDFRRLGVGREGFRNLLPLIRKIKALEDYFVVSISTFAENHAESHTRLPVLRLASGPAYNETLLAFAKALWFGDWPRPGVYFDNRLYVWLMRRMKAVGRQKGRGIFKHEMGLITFAEVAPIRTQGQKRSFTIELPELSRSQYFTLLTPNCDYYALPDGVKNYDSLMMWLGMPYGPLKSRRPKGEEKALDA